MGVSFILNGKETISRMPENTTLLEVLREEMRLYGVKKGCESGECGACTVLLNGRNVHACMTLIGEVEGCRITTIEGLSKDGDLDPIQKAFAQFGAVQCGYCTPGMILAVKSLLDRNPNPSRAEIQQGIAGNICRCTGYEQIIEAVEQAAEWMKEHETDGV